LLSAVRKYIFKWLKERLSLYDKTSFKQVYALDELNPEIAKKKWGFKDNEINASDSDFIYDIPFKKDVEQEVSDLSNSFKGLSFTGLSLDLVLK